MTAAVTRPALTNSISVKVHFFGNPALPGDIFENWQIKQKLKVVLF